MKCLSEKQKMLSGQWYFSTDRTLSAERAAAKSLCHQINQLAPANRSQVNSQFKRLFGKASSFWIEPPFYCDYGYNLHVGQRFYANHGVTILDSAPVTIGDNVLLGPGVIIATATHAKDPVERAKGLCQALPIQLGNNVWVGMGAKILPGVQVGDNVIVAAGSVVTKDVAANTTVTGIPAK